MVAQYLAKSAVEPDHHLIHCFLAHQLKIGSLGEVPANQSISGFIGTPLPGAVGIGKIGLHPKLFLQPSMEVMFTAIIQGGGFAGQFGQLAKEEELYRTGFFGPYLGYLLPRCESRFYVHPQQWCPLPNDQTPHDYQSLLVGVGSKPGGGF